MKRPFVSCGGVLALSLGVGTAILVACSSSDNAASTPSTDAGPETGRVVQPDAPANDEDVAEAGSACVPHPLTGALTWHPPKPIDPSACTANEIDGFIQACRLSSNAVCDAFKQQNPRCAACAYTSATEASWGPYVDYAAEGLTVVNQGGCLALSLSELDEKGCGGSYELFGECRDQACNGCFPLKNGVKALDTCERDPQTDTICATWIAQADVKCPKKAALPARCTLASAFNDSVASYVTFWCSTPADGGLDGGADADAN